MKFLVSHVTLVLYNALVGFVQLVPVQYNIIRLIGLLQSSTTLVIVGCWQMKILEKIARFGVYKSQTIPNIETATERCSTEISFWKKVSSKS